MEPLNYIRALNIQFTYLFDFARRINEIDTVAGLSGEFRGAQDANWNTVATAHEVFDELKALGSKQTPLSRSEVRHLLCLYAQLAEAGGVYEGLLNIIRVAQLKPYNLWPFRDLVRVRQAPRAVIGPNANAMFRRLAETATAIGMTGLAHLLELAFRDDIRNAMAHADYILVPDGLRLRRRNGGHPAIVPNSELVSALQIALFYFELLLHFRRATAELYRPARTVVGRFSENPPMQWTIEFTDAGSLSISSNKPGFQTDSVYERQKRINDRLGGRMVAAYVAPGMNVRSELLAEIAVIGFEVMIVDFDNLEQFEVLVAEIEANNLWDGSPQKSDAYNAVLTATPLGFRWIATGTEFQDWLPDVDEVEIV